MGSQVEHVGAVEDCEAHGLARLSREGAQVHPRELRKLEAGEERSDEADDAEAEPKALRVRIARQVLALEERRRRPVCRGYGPLEELGDRGERELAALGIEESEHVEDAAERLDGLTFAERN